MNKLIEKRITEIIQAPEMRTITGLNSKTKNIQISVMINGNDAIDRACAENGDIRAALLYILSVLPKPRIQNLRDMACSIVYEEFGDFRKAEDYLNCDVWKHKKAGDSLINGGLIESKTEDTGRLPP